MRNCSDCANYIDQDTSHRCNRFRHVLYAIFKKKNPHEFSYIEAWKIAHYTTVGCTTYHKK